MLNRDQKQVWLGVSSLAIVVAATACSVKKEKVYRSSEPLAAASKTVAAREESAGDFSAKKKSQEAVENKSPCPDFSGVYLPKTTHHKDVKSITIAQKGCESIQTVDDFSIDLAEGQSDLPLIKFGFGVKALLDGNCRILETVQSGDGWATHYWGGRGLQGYSAKASFSPDSKLILDFVGCKTTSDSETDQELIRVEASLKDGVLTWIETAKDAAGNESSREEVFVREPSREKAAAESQKSEK